jgi:predicted kinase
MSDLVLTVGLPGSGKSTHARQWFTLSQQIIIDPDDIRQILEPAWRFDGKGVWKQYLRTILRTMVVAAPTDHDIVIADCNCTLKTVQEREALARTTGRRIVYHVLNASDDEAYERNSVRDASPSARHGTKRVPPEAMDWMKSSIEEVRRYVHDLYKLQYRNETFLAYFN